MTPALIAQAQDRLAGVVRRTPLLSSPFLDEIAGRRVLVKAECLQHTGSFKFRGAWSAVSALPEGTGGVIAYSSGNHAQGVALAARMRGLPAVIVMPSDAPAVKRANTAALGAEVVLYERHVDSREEIGDRIAAERGLTLIRPFDDPQVIAGQASCGIEIADAAPAEGLDAAEVLVCCGGGGLSAGIALALEARAPGMRVRTVEPEGYDDTRRSLQAGHAVANDTARPSLCDAIVTPQPGALTLPILQRLAGPGLAVAEDEALHAMALAFERLRIVLEPGGAVALAAALWHGAALRDGPVVAVATGGNVDPAVHIRALDRFATKGETP